jgi:hypothetical protein
MFSEAEAVHNTHVTGAIGGASRIHALRGASIVRCNACDPL